LKSHAYFSAFSPDDLALTGDSAIPRQKQNEFVGDFFNVRNRDFAATIGIAEAMTSHS
jgi:hypothetical protein